MTTNVTRFIEELDGGVFYEKLSRVLSDVAGATLDHEDKGKVTISLEFKPIGSGQVHVEHSVEFKRPTLRGYASEKDTTATPMHVGTKGALSFFPENQGTFLDQAGKQTDKSFPYQNDQEQK